MAAPGGQDGHAQGLEDDTHLSLFFNLDFYFLPLVFHCNFRHSYPGHANIITLEESGSSQPTPSNIPLRKGKKKQSAKSPAPAVITSSGTSGGC